MGSFITNDENGSLLDRFETIFNSEPNPVGFDVLVGYFRASGFRRFYDNRNFRNLEKTRILVGLNTDKHIANAVRNANESELDLYAYDEVTEQFQNTVLDEFETEDDTLETEDAILEFTKMLQSGKIEIRAHPSQNIHAKVYIIHNSEKASDPGRVITGSSNFSENGLVAQREFNVELREPDDHKFASAQFEKLWSEGIPVTNQYIDVVQNISYFSDKYTPHELYLKFLYEHFRDEIDNDKTDEIQFPDGFLKLKYQSEAVSEAKNILNRYNGCFLSDVVGLGKTYITSMLLQVLGRGKTLVVCPPALVEYWENTLRDFFVPGCKVVSSGIIDQISGKSEFRDYKYLVVDEAHHFRNEVTDKFDNLYKLSAGKNEPKKVILVSATPYNNSVTDIETQLKLFLDLNNSPIPGVRNISNVFSAARTAIGQFERGTAEYTNEQKRQMDIIREDILRHLMVRRTRSEITKYYANDLKSQNLKFPEIQKPTEITYTLDDEGEAAFDLSVELLNSDSLSGLSYARYTPLLYLNDEIKGNEKTQQTNARGFIKGLLVKRLESSKFAFQQSLSRLIRTHEIVIDEFVNNNIVYVGDKVIYEMLDNGSSFEKIEERIIKEDIKKYPAAVFRDEFLHDLKSDLQKLKQLQEMWNKVLSDHKFNAFVSFVKEDSILESNKFIIFTESKETADFLFENLTAEFPKQVSMISSQGGVFGDSEIDSKTGKYSLIKFENAKSRIVNIFDANDKGGIDEADKLVRILITTDVLAEGMNLHNANAMVNYDLPWNPTKVLQRVGRVNRVGTTFDKIHIYNIFPTIQAESELHLRENIISKINEFHLILGEDAKYLSEDDETISQHNFSEKTFAENLLDELENPMFDDENEFSNVPYLELLRKLRDDEPVEYAKIKKLRKKIRVAQKSVLVKVNGKDEILPAGLVTFVRNSNKRQNFERFIYTDGVEEKELKFSEAVRWYECQKEAKAEKLEKNLYYDLLAKNLGFKNEEKITVKAQTGRSNIKQIINKLEAIKNDPIFNSTEKQNIAKALGKIKQGILSKNVEKKFSKELRECGADQSKIYEAIMFRHEDWMQKARTNAGEFAESMNEVVLSKMIVGA